VAVRNLKSRGALDTPYEVTKGRGEQGARGQIVLDKEVYQHRIIAKLIARSLKRGMIKGSEEGGGRRKGGGGRGRGEGEKKKALAEEKGSVNFDA
jgi:hypothetical protein